MFTLLGIASSKNITPDEIITGNATAINESGYVYFPPSLVDTTPDATGNLAAINESDSGYWYNQGRALFNASKYNESIEAFNKAIELNQSYAEAWEYKGNALSELGKNKDASQAYKKAFELDPKITYGCSPCGQQGRVEWYWKDKGDGFLISSAVSHNENDSEEALLAYDKAIEVNPDFSSAWFCKGSALKNLARYNGDLGKFDEAIQAYNKSYELDPTTFENFNYERTIGDVRYDQGMALKKLGHNS